MKIYHMVIENLRTRERKIFMNKHQGSAPQGWRCVGVCGYHEKPGTSKGSGGLNETERGE